MIYLVFGNALWQLVKQADMVSKGVLLLLLLMSIVCWTIFFYKLILLRIKKRQLKKVLSDMKEVKSLDQLLTAASVYSGKMPGFFLSRSLVSLRSQLELIKQSNQTVDYDSIQDRFAQIIDEIMGQEESYLPFISTCANVSPLIGLFGTVWGLIHSFVRISQQQTADIATVAPGIAEALITTLAGLLVAIPAFVMYNYLAVQVGRIEQQLVTLSDSVGTVMQPLMVTKEGI